MKGPLAALKDFLHKHPKLRNGVRELRWQLKKIPVIDRISIAFDAAYFKDAGEERPSADVRCGADEYAEAYAKFIVPRAHGRVLDVGCGRGYLTQRIAQHPRVEAVVGVDKIKDFCNPHPKITYVSENLPPSGDFPGKFDVVVASEFVEHITEEAHKSIVAKVARALTPHGVYIGSTPHNPTNFKTFSGSRFHIREYSREDLEKLLRSFFHDVVVTALPEHCLVWEARRPIRKPTW